MEDQERNEEQLKQEVSKEEIYFGVEPIRFIDDVCNVIDSYVSDGIDTLDQQLEVNLKGQVVLSKIHASCNSFREKMEMICNTNYDKFELYMLRNILKVPEPVDVEEFSSLTPEQVEILKKEEDEIDERLRAAEQEITKLTSENRRLKSQTQRAKKQIEKGRIAAKKFEFLKHTDCVNENAIANILKMHNDIQPSIEKGKQILQELELEGEPSCISLKRSDSWENLKTNVELDKLRFLNEVSLASLSVN